MFLELAKFASLLLSILSLDVLFHTAFLVPGSHLEQRLLPALESLLIAALVCLGSGLIFRTWEYRTKLRVGSVAGSLPMLLFWWATGIMALLFALRWLIERYYLGLGR